MRRQGSVQARLYNHLFPYPSPSDPPTFHDHISKNLIPEVRMEVRTFYGPDKLMVEARYPGLNYSHPPHRVRLGRYPHHTVLFKAFDALGLTAHEIATICHWEGTLYAREQYEKNSGTVVQDTTGDDVSVVNSGGLQVSIKVVKEVEVVTTEDALADAHYQAVNNPADARSEFSEAVLEDNQDDGDDETPLDSGELLNTDMGFMPPVFHETDMDIDSVWDRYIEEAQESEGGGPAALVPPSAAAAAA
ncbi:hypothetical protein LTR39_000890 [Cryomyces antarcticus]|nr:hypothetical protein LTR39_000890 [Cryomyces antarcticus]